MAKRRYETITLNGERFELDTKETVSTSKNWYGVARRTVDDCYERPSSYKRAIFEDWWQWFNKNGGYCGVASYNCMQFTIEGVVFDKDTQEEYYCYITKAHNKCWKITA